MVQVVQHCTGMSASLIGFGHEGWFLQQAVQLCFVLLGGQVVQRCHRQSLESQAVKHCWLIHVQDHLVPRRAVQHRCADGSLGVARERRLCIGRRGRARRGFRHRPRPLCTLSLL